MDIIDQYKTDEAFVKFSAPMVRYSKDFGVDVAYTPMIMASSFTQSEAARDVEFTTDSSDIPVIAQFGSNDKNEVGISSRLISDHVNGIDLNCGCPQRWAIKEGIGCQLLREEEKLICLLKEIKRNSPSTSQGKLFSVSAKIRLLDDNFISKNKKGPIHNTLDLIKSIADSGVDFVTIHCRFPGEKDTATPHFDIFKHILSANIHHVKGGPLPIILNGNIKSLKQCRALHEEMKFHGVMAANGLLENPAMFLDDSRKPSNEKIIELWLSLGSKHCFGNSVKNIQNQLLWMSSDMNKTNLTLIKSQNTLSSIQSVTRNILMYN